MLLPVACTWPYYHVFRLLLWSLGLVSVLSASVLFGLLGRRRRGGRRGIGHLVRATATSPMGLVKKTQIGASFAFSQVPRRVLYYSTTITPEKINIPSYETVLKAVEARQRASREGLFLARNTSQAAGSFLQVMYRVQWVSRRPLQNPDVLREAEI